MTFQNKISKNWDFSTCKAQFDENFPSTRF